MSYVKQNFYSGQTLLASHLNHIEDGIDNILTEVNKSIQEAAKQATAAANSATAAQESETSAGQSATAAAVSEKNAAASATAAANSAADAKNTLESIPDDYSTLSGKVDDNTSGINELKEDLADKVPKKDYAPETKTESMTQPVGKDENGKLWTTPGSVCAVSSVNSKTGAVVLTADDVHAMRDDTVIPTVPDKVSAFENDAGYLTAHQDISGKLDADKLPEAVNDALAQAKASGDFDGTDGYSPTANVTQNDNGATITITDKNGTTTATVTNGKDGIDGIPGKDGYTPVKGTDYFTESDKTELVNAVLSALPAAEGVSY